VLARLRNPWPDSRAERTLGAVSCLVGVIVVAMIAFVAVHAWPTFQHNGLSWLGWVKSNQASKCRPRA
jgi:ABC-type phosphate transport system permease subunit